MIYIYTDGVTSDSHLMISMQSVTNLDVRFCTNIMIADGCLEHAKMIIMPGGADMYYCEKLNGRGNKIIRDFVNNGGSYLGICAGAYYASSALDWGCGEISGSRELDFFKGKATGPIYDWIENKTSIYDGSWIKAVEIETNNREAFLTQYNGGPVFEETADEVIARYNTLENNPPAIINGTFGQGRYILSSPHIENFGHLLIDGLYKHHNKSYERERAEIDKLLEFETVQKQFFQSIVARLL